MRPIVIIGAGVGGLTAAALLAAAGEDVIVCEAAATPGGKLRELKIDGHALDAGPTVFTMRWVFDAIFAAAGASLDDYLTLRPVTTIARHAWGPDARLDLFADIDASADAIGSFAGAAEASRFRAFAAEARRTYTTLESSFLDAPATNPLGLTARIGLSRPGDLLSIRPFETLWGALGGYFHDPRLRQLFGRYATYSGASPYLAPATLMLIAHVENSGVWQVDGGMHQIARALEALAASRGATFRYASPVVEIVVGRGGAEGVILASGERIDAAAVVVNADPQALATGRFGPAASRAVAAMPPRERSLSALTWTLVAETSGFPLSHHNVFFADDYRAEFDAIFGQQRLPATPSVYICAENRGDKPTGHARERLHMIVNAPATADTRGLTTGEIDACEQATFAMLERSGLTVARTADATVRTAPADFAALFPATGGALYGRASHGWRASFQRPGSTTRIPGLYLAGGATHPGAGVPMAALSGRLAARALLSARRSTER
nr:1-hydroxycarotenoid 3,4-desaturase CrtD [Polymorphobacter sp.]